MPELPEVQTVVNFLKPNLSGKTIICVKNPNKYQNVFQFGNLSEYNKFLKNRYIKDIFRRGKYIILKLDYGYLLVHLRMTGKLQINKPNLKEMKYVSFKLSFKDGSHLFFQDIRKFGRIYISKDLNWLEQKIGIEPLSKKFNTTWLYNNLNKYKRMIKPFLMDQKIIAGLGNIYVDEALWKSYIHPKAKTNNINKIRSDILVKSIKKILIKAIEYQGTTIINFSYGINKKGDFSNELQIFGQPNKPCPRCKSLIIKKFLNQRGTHFCNNCQKH